MDELEKIRQQKLRELMERATGGTRQEASDEPFEVTDESFDEEISKNEVILVDFWAPWCGPCRMVAPVIRELARAYKGRVAFGKLNTDENPRTATRFRVMSIPTLMLFKRGKPVDVLVGAGPRSRIEAMIKKHLT